MESLRIFSDGGGRVGGGELRELSTAEAEAGLWVASELRELQTAQVEAGVWVAVSSRRLRTAEATASEFGIF
nr:hypothetical protein Itr_chr02CG14110 [Ipomoea trifida]GLL39533.1 hypothetical protein Itr_chr11CG13620 [Ipomoea trifida]